MINTKCNIILAAMALMLAGCATQAPQKDAADSLAAPAPSYDEKTDELTLDDVKVSCPNDSKWEALTWKKLVPVANACVKSKDWNKVEKMGNFLATHAHLTPWGPYYMALSAEGRKDYPRAIWMLELALKKDPKEGLFHYELGRIYWQGGDEANAVKNMQMASDLGPGLTEAHFVMGQLAMQRHDYSAAQTMFQRALKADSKHVPSLLGMSELTMANKDYAKAEDYLSRVVSLNPKHARARFALARVQEEHLKKFSDALKNYKELKHMSASKKMDEPINVNWDEKIKTLEKTLSQAEKAQVTVRTPSAERKVE